MGLIIETTDFVAPNAIATDVYTSAGLELFINQFEKPILYELLGVALADLFIANVTNHVPTDARFLAIFNPFTKDISSELVVSLGIKDMLLKEVGFEYVRTQPQTNSIQGNVEVENSLNKASKMSFTTLCLSYNAMVKTYKAIQTFIESEKETYPEYKGFCKEYISWA